MRTCGPWRPATVQTRLVSFLLQPVHLKPLHVLQCHSKKDSAEDFSTQLWACAFQPLHGSTGTASNQQHAERDVQREDSVDLLFTNRGQPPGGDLRRRIHLRDRL